MSTVGGGSPSVVKRCIMVEHIASGAGGIAVGWCKEIIVATRGEEAVGELYMSIGYGYGRYVGRDTTILGLFLDKSFVLDFR